MSETRKVVINNCYGGFGLSPRGTLRLSELRGHECYFFEYNFKRKRYQPLSLEQAEKAFSWSAFKIPDANALSILSREWEAAKTDEDMQDYRERWDALHIDADRSLQRDDPLLVQVIVELGEAANGAHAQLCIVEIPADVQWEISEYDGIEHIAEVHRTWSAS